MLFPRFHDRCIVDMSPREGPRRTDRRAVPCRAVPCHTLARARTYHRAIMHVLIISSKRVISPLTPNTPLQNV